MASANTSLPSPEGAEWKRHQGKVGIGVVTVIRQSVDAWCKPRLLAMAWLVRPLVTICTGSRFRPCVLDVGNSVAGLIAAIPSKEASTQPAEKALPTNGLSLDWACSQLSVSPELRSWYRGFNALVCA